MTNIVNNYEALFTALGTAQPADTINEWADRGLCSRQEAQGLTKDVRLIMQGESAISYMRTALAGVYGWNKVTELENIIDHVFIDEFNVDQGKVLRKKLNDN